MSDVRETWAELERVRRDIATAHHHLESALPDTVVAWHERLEHAEAKEQDLLAQLEQPDANQGPVAAGRAIRSPT